MEQFTRESLIDRLQALPAHVVYGQLVGSDHWGQKMKELVPHSLHHGLVLHTALGESTGHFLTAVLNNDLMGAFGKADDFNRPNIGDICHFLYNFAPASCFGSKEAVQSWKQSGGIIGHEAA